MSPCPEPMSPSLKNNESKDQSAWTFHVSSPGGGGTLLYNPYRYVLPHRVGFLRCFDLKTGIHFAHFGLESCMVFEGTYGVYERIYRFNSK